MSEVVTTVATPVAPAVEESLKDHEAQFSGPQSAAVETDGDDDDAPAETNGRRRSRSSQASPADVEKISEYTKRLRAAQTELGFSIERQQGESDRVFRLRRDAEIAEALRDARKAKSETPKPTPAVADAPTFDEKEPTWDDVKDADDPVLALNRKLAAYDRRKDRFEQQQTEHQQHVAAASQAQLQQQEQTAVAFKGRLDAYLSANPTHRQVMESADSLGPIPPALSWAFIQDDKGPELMYYFANHPDELSDMILLSNSAEVTDQSVALLRRRLNARAQDETTGASSPVQPPRVLSRPPTPVRTAAMKTDTSDPDENEPLSAHEKRYAVKRRV